MNGKHPLPELRDFKNWLYLALQAMGHKAPSPVDDAIQFDIADWFQYLKEPKKQIRGMRGVGKSVIVAAGISWLIYWNPNITIGILSSNAPLASDLLGLAIKLIDIMEFTQHLKAGADDKDGQYNFTTKARTKPQKDPTVWAGGITTNKTGHHFDIIICDDVESLENSDTVTKRDKLLTACAELEDLLNPGGQIIYMNTPQTNDSIYIELEKRGYIPRRWPARLKNPDDAEESKWVSPMLLDRVRTGQGKPGDPTYPKRFSDTYLKNKEMSYGSARYSLQMECDPRLADTNRYPLKLSHLIVMFCHPETAPGEIMWGQSNPISDIDLVGFHNDRFYGPAFVKDDTYGPYEKSVMFIDPSGGGVTDGDELAWAIVKMRRGMLFVLSVGGLADGPTAHNMTTLALKAKEFNIKDVYVEENFGKGMFTQLLTPVMNRVNGPTSVTNVPSSNVFKEKRIIDTLLPLLGSRKLVFDVSVASDRILCHQFANVALQRGSLKHDDRLDALAGALKQFAEAMPALDAERIHENEREAERQATIDEFLHGSSKPGSFVLFTDGTTNTNLVMKGSQSNLENKLREVSTRSNERQQSLSERFLGRTSRQS